MSKRWPPASGRSSIPTAEHGSGPSEEAGARSWVSTCGLALYGGLSDSKQSSEHPPSQPAVSALILELAFGACLLRMMDSTVFHGGECTVQTLYNEASAR